VSLNIASRVQGLALSPAILATDSVVDHPESARMLETGNFKPTAHRHALRGIAAEMAVYEIP
jgi:class 3 adenylate cyclase